MRLHFVHKTPNWLFLVMELVSGGELFDQIVQNRSPVQHEGVCVMNRFQT